MECIFQNCNQSSGKGLLILFCAWLCAHQRKWKSSNVFTKWLSASLGSVATLGISTWGPRMFCLQGNHSRFPSASVDSGNNNVEADKEWGEEILLSSPWKWPHEKAEFLGTPLAVFQRGPRAGEGVLCWGWIQTRPVQRPLFRTRHVWESSSSGWALELPEYYMTCSNRLKCHRPIPCCWLGWFKLLLLVRETSDVQDISTLQRVNFSSPQ